MDTYAVFDADGNQVSELDYVTYEAAYAKYLELVEEMGDDPGLRIGFAHAGRKKE